MNATTPTATVLAPAFDAEVARLRESEVLREARVRCIEDVLTGTAPVSALDSFHAMQHFAEVAQGAGLDFAFIGSPATAVKSLVLDFFRGIVALVINEGKRFKVSETEREALLDVAPLNTLRFFRDCEELWVEYND